MKKPACFIFILLCLLKINAQVSSVRLGVLRDLSCIPCAHLIENREKLQVQNMSFKFFESEQSELLSILKGEIGAGFFKTEDAAKIYFSTNKAFMVLGVVQNGNSYLITNDETYGSLTDLKGKKILTSQKDSEWKIFEHIVLKQTGNYEQSEVSSLFDFSVPLSEIPNQLILKKADYALVTEPFATIIQKNSIDSVRSENLQKLYSKAEEGSVYPCMLLVVRKDFAKKNKKLLKQLADIYKNSVQWTNLNPSKAAFLSEKYGFGLPAEIVEKSIPNASLTWKNSAGVKSDIEKYLSILERENPDEEFYF